MLPGSPSGGLADLGMGGIKATPNDFFLSSSPQYRNCNEAWKQESNAQPKHTALLLDATSSLAVLFPKTLRKRMSQTAGMSWPGMANGKW